MTAVYEGQRSPSLVRLLFVFLRMGSTAFGGPAMIAYLRKMAVEQRGWIKSDSFQDGVALCQAIPGPTVMHLAAYIGLQIRGVGGAAVSYIGMIFPAFLLLLILTSAYSHAHSIPLVLSVFSGLGAVIVAIMANATLSFGRTSVRSWKDAAVALIAAALFAVAVNPVVTIVLAAVLGTLLDSRQMVVEKAPHDVDISRSAVPLLAVVLLAASGLLSLFVLRKDLFELAVVMSKVDLTAFGGGFASIPLMFHEVVEVRSWMDAPTFLNGIVLGQVTPGPVIITATFVGYLVGGLPGAVTATIAIFLPSFLVLIGIAPWFERLRSLPWFARSIRGILCSFVGLLFTVTVRFGLNVHWDLMHAAVAIAASAALLGKVDILWVVLAGTAVSALAF